MVARIALLAKSCTETHLELRYEVIMSVPSTTEETVEERCKLTTERITELLNPSDEASEDAV